MRDLIQIAPPESPPAPPAQVFPFRSRSGDHIFVVEGSRVYDVEQPGLPSMETDFDRIDGLGFGVQQVAAPSPPRSLSLNLAQMCNLGCGYCYAGQGPFGGPEARMSRDTARRSIDLLIQGAEKKSSVLVGFMGGEPLLHRELLHDAARYAAAEGARRGVPVRFSITTNGTLLNDADARLFSELEWTVQISLDGKPELQDRQRPYANGAGSYGAVLRALERIERAGRPRMLSARSTVARGWDSLPDQLDHLLGLGFDDAGFAPVLASATPGWALDTADLRRLLAEMIECGETTLAHWRDGRRYCFTNLRSALEQIHQGTCRPYPCGAGGGYLSVSAEGELFACHRFVNDPRYRMGSIHDGPDDRARADFLAARHVDRQEPCASCWARYLCGGGCHHEVIHAGRPACDYVRGWLEFCLRAYVELSSIPAGGSCR